MKAWQQLYDTAAVAGFTLAKAESAHSLADLYKTKKEYVKPIEYSELAAKAWGSAGNQQRRIDARNMETGLLVQQGRKDKALQVDEELLPLVKASKNVSAQFIADRAISEILDGTGKLDRVESALKDAESLVGFDVKVPGVEPSLIVAHDLFEGGEDGGLWGGGVEEKKRASDAHTRTGVRLDFAHPLQHGVAVADLRWAVPFASFASVVCFDPSSCPSIRWTNFNATSRTYQGELVDKAEYVRAFFRNIRHRKYDTTKLSYLWRFLLSRCVEDSSGCVTPGA